MSTLKWKAYVIELTDNIEKGYLEVDEKINDEQFYWVDLYILTKEIP